MHVVDCRFGSLDLLSMSCGRYVCCSVSVNSAIIMSGLIFFRVSPILPQVEWLLQDSMVFAVSHSVLIVKIWQHKRGYPLAVHSNVLESVHYTFICNQVILLNGYLLRLL